MNVEKLIGEANCPVCGRHFAFYPAWHQWKIEGKGRVIRLCSYGCMRELEKRKLEAVEEKKRQADEIRREKQREAWARKRQRQKEREEAARIRAAQKAEHEAAVSRTRVLKLIAEMERMMAAASWANQPEEERLKDLKRLDRLKGRLWELEEALAG